MVRNNNSNSTPRRSARLNKGKATTSTPFTTPPVNSAVSASKSTGRRPPLAPRTRSDKKRGTPSLASSSKKQRINALSPKQPSTPPPKSSPASPSPSQTKRKGNQHKPYMMLINCHIRDTILKDSTQKHMRRMVGGKVIKVRLLKYKPSEESFLGMPIDCCVDYDGKHSVPPDLPNSHSLLKQLCLDRVPADYLENENVSPSMMKFSFFLPYLENTFDMPAEEVSAIIGSISDADIADAARARVPINATLDAPLSAALDASPPAAHASASPSMDSVMEALGVTASISSSLAQNQATFQAAIGANQSAIAGLAQNQATFQKHQEASEAAISANQSAIAGLAQNQATFQKHQEASEAAISANQSAIAGLAQNQATFQAASQKRHEASEADISTNRSAILGLAQNQAGLTQRTAKLEDDSTGMKKEISNLKKEFGTITQSAQKQFNELASKASAAAAHSMGGRTLFGDGSSSPTMASRLPPVQENAASAEDPLGFEDIAQSRGNNDLINRCKELVADSSGLPTEHKSKFLEWHNESYRKGDEIESVEELKVSVYAVENVSDLAKLESIQELWDELDRLDAIAKVGPSTFVMAQDSELYEDNFGISLDFLPALYGCTIELSIECHDCETIISIITSSPEEAKDALGAMLRLASRTNNKIAIQPGFAQTKSNGVKYDLCLSEMQMEKPIAELVLEGLNCKLPESTATALSSMARKLVLDKTKVEAGCASLLFEAMASDDRALETIEIGNGTSIPSNQLLEYMRSNDLSKISLKAGVAWREFLSADVRVEFKKKIVDAFKTGRNFGFTMHHDNVLAGPLKDAKEDLVRALSADHPSIQKMRQQGASELPFNVDKPKKLDKNLKEWVQENFPNEA